MMFTFAFFFLVYPACSSQFCRCWSAWPKSEVTNAQGRGERECLCPIVLAVLPLTRSFPKKNFWPYCLLWFYFFDLRSSPFPSHWCFMYGCQRLNIRNCCSLYISRSRWEKMPFHSRFLNDYQLDVFFVRFSILCQHDRPYASISEQRTPLFYLECVGFVCWCLFIQFWTRWAFL